MRGREARRPLRAPWKRASALFVCVGLLAPLGWAQSDGASEAPERGSTWRVGSGDSWFSMRSRICPVEALQEANPELADRKLRAGDEIVAPFVPLPVLAAREQALAEAERLGVEAREEARRAESAAAEAKATLELQTAELRAIEGEIAALRDGRSTARQLVAVLALGILVLVACLVLVASSLYAARRSSALRERRLKELEHQHAELRRSLGDLEVQLQRRMLKLLSWHETRVVTDRDVEEATAPVLDMARKLKERHAS